MQTEYDQLYKQVKKYIVENDPVGLIWEGAPEDEYDSYIHQLISRSKKAKSEKEIYDIIKDIFNFDGYIEENCKKLSVFLFEKFLK